MAKRTTTSSADLIPYTPTEWTERQHACHVAADLDAALKAASMLASGWYRRSVTIDYQIAGDDERYMMRPSEIAPLDGWRPVYKIEAA